MADTPNTEDVPTTATDQKQEDATVQPNGMNPHIIPDGLTEDGAPTTEE